MSEPTDLTHDKCLDRHSSPCEGVVEYHPTNPVRYRANGAWVVFPRCEKHYEAYADRCEALIERQRQYEESLYCKHGTYVGDWAGADYLCGECESE